ncbi:MAG: guanosine-3',5'-bis(diphosphate) 3'-pyrophosphohydrolase [Saprospiraceae bacterium]|jgi:guanosine-3',5'-bis(diphosphate) 3'-pyrophosphohydrolase
MTEKIDLKKREEEDKRLIMAAYRNLLRTLEGKMDENDKKNIRKAYELAVDAHKKQRRKSGEPYVLHPIEVARITVDEVGLGPTAVICALLHDVVEDTDVTLDDIREKFGDKVALIVDGLTKLDASYNADSPQAENFKKVLTTLVEDVRVVLIKMSDRLHNMRTLGSMPRHKQLKIAAETSYIYAPLAHRLGLYSFKTEFQDLAMKITEPETYYSVSTKLHETKKSREQYIEEFIAPLRAELDEIGVPYRILGRPKSIYSIWNKIKTKKVPFEEIYDLFAVRIIIDVPPKKEKSFCWMVYSTITDIYRPIPERLKDWVTTPKANGYESLHTTIIGPKGRYVEVQIRSERMDEISEKGFAAHWKYKGVNGQPDVFDTWLDSVRDILENGNDNATEFINDFKTNLFSEEIYVYTPNGDMKVLPKGATALDFAFSIHTDIGYRATAIKVNKKLVPMGQALENGDQISVTTNRSQKPSESWLKMVVTGKARSKIRSAMKEERRRQGSFGKELLQRKFNNMKVDFDSAVDALVKFFNYSNYADLYFSIAMEEINLVSTLKKFKVETGRLVEIIEVKKEEERKVPVKGSRLLKRFSGTPKLLIGGESAEQYEYSFATCCKPVLGDDIFAYVTATAGMKIHRSNCANAEHLMANYGYRILKAEWVSGANSEFKAELIITGVDDGPGVIQKLTRQINDLDINIRSFNISGDEGYFEAKVGIFVTNTDQLTLAVRSLQNLDNVSTVIREEV